MRILISHNYYLNPGGEDQVFQDECTLLTTKGHIVRTMTVDNFEIINNGKFRTAIKSLWSRDSYQKIKLILKDFKPEIAHFHNIFPILSPSVYAACKKMDVPVVQTLHNYRLLCPAATFYRGNRVCVDCYKENGLLPSILNKCYRKSILGTASVVAMLQLHNYLNTWKNDVDMYIPLTAFARNQFVNKVPCQKMTVKSNFLFDVKNLTSGISRYSLFIGRLAPEKGIMVLLEAWQRISKFKLKVIGNGQLSDLVQQRIIESKLFSVTFHKHLPRNESIQYLQNANALIVPSLWFEGFPLVIVEAFAYGVPVIASRLGAMAEIVDDGKTGLLFTPGDAEDLASKVDWAWNHLSEMAEMGKAARREYEEKYTAERNYELLMEIYQKTIDNHRRHR